MFKTHHFVCHHLTGKKCQSARFTSKVCDKLGLKHLKFEEHTSKQSKISVIISVLILLAATELKARTSHCHNLSKADISMTLPETSETIRQNEVSMY